VAGKLVCHQVSEQAEDESSRALATFEKYG